MLKQLQSRWVGDVFWECVPEGGSGSQRGLAADSGESDRCNNWWWLNGESVDHKRWRCILLGSCRLQLVIACEDTEQVLLPLLDGRLSATVFVPFCRSLRRVAHDATALVIHIHTCRRYYVGDMCQQQNFLSVTCQSKHAEWVRVRQIGMADLHITRSDWWTFK